MCTEELRVADFIPSSAIAAHVVVSIRPHGGRVLICSANESTICTGPQWRGEICISGSRSILVSKLAGTTSFEIGWLGWSEAADEARP